MLYLIYDFLNNCRHQILKDILILTETNIIFFTFYNSTKYLSQVPMSIFTPYYTDYNFYIS